MKYTSEQAITEIKRRSREIKKARERKLTKALTAVTCFIAIALVGEVGLLSGPGVGGDLASSYGSFMLTPESGIYVIISVVAFLVGVSIPLLIKKLRNKGAHGE
ncbi:MAG: hypothetical protein J5537_07175 [Lachnospiraceae bacterium]|nr:hypothetical protein [Lachnospiraceae bacterium]